MQKKRYFVIYGILYVIAAFAPLGAQQMPPIQSFTPQEYQGENQNWAIAQGLDDHIYVANSHNLLAYDGVRWRSSTTTNGSVFRSVAAKDSLIFTGQYMEFGFWKKNSFSELVYTSISERLQEPMLADEEFWNIIVLGDWVLFQSLDRIYSYHTINHTFKIVNAPSNKAQIFTIDDTVFFQNQNSSIYRIENGAPVLVVEDRALQDKNVVGIYKQEKRLVVVLDDGHFFYLQDANLKEMQMQAGKQLNDLHVYCTAQLKDGSFVLGTVAKGLYHISKNGTLLRVIDQRKGLNNNTVLATFQDKEDNLWLGLDNGLAVVNINSRFTEYLDNLGRLGLVYATKSFQGNLYLGTNQGLFVKKENTDEDFELISGTDGQVWNLTVVESTLFCGHNKGTFVVTDQKAALISKLPGTWGVKMLQKSTLIQGNYDGLSILKKQNNKWVFSHRISGFDTSSRFFLVLAPNKILVNHEYKGLFELTLNEDHTKVIQTNTHTIMGHGSSIVNFQGEIIYTSLDGAFKKSKDSLAFLPEQSLDQLLFKEAGGIHSIVMPDEKENRLWCFTAQGLSYVYPDSFNASLALQTIPIPSFFRRSLGVSGFENITPIANNRYLIGISNGFVMVDTSIKEEDTFSLGINTVTSESKKGTLTKQSLVSGQVLSFQDNTLHFNYSVPQFNKYKEVYYQYRLVGLTESWSNWSTTANCSFNKLDYGEYTLEVRAKVGDTLASNMASYTFTISRPWYATKVAITLYGLGLVLVFFSVHKIYKSYYTKRQNRLLSIEKKKLNRKKLETEKEFIQLKNEKLRIEIESKSRELAVSTMSIIKKNQFLSTIKEELKKVEPSRAVKAIIKTIDKNIENEDDWRYFEEAFNNADKDFLQGLKEQHSELTPNDLRLCAYLRLNLSSKEIAPLLNISVKSVEVKRYRLRKKMNLPHESSLTDYILSL